MEQPAGSDGFEQFIVQHGAALMRYAYVLTGNPHDAADLVQEGLVRLRGAWAGLRQDGNPVSYVRTTISRLHISRWRRLRREHLTDSVPERGREDPGLLRVDDDEGLDVVLSALPRRQHAVLVLRYYENMSDEQIAETLGISKGTVRSQAFRGLRTLRDRISDTSSTVMTPSLPRGRGETHA